jgi:predicted DNA-binding transcriptional regulator AlpA
MSRKPVVTAKSNKRLLTSTAAPPNSASKETEKTAQPRTDDQGHYLTIAGATPRRGSSDDATAQYLTAPMVCARYSITDMSLWRWLNDPKLNFPKPALVVRTRRFWLEGDLVAWERSLIPHGDDAVPGKSKRRTERLEATTT